MKRGTPHCIEDCPSLKIGPNLTLQDRSRAADRSGFVIKELKLFFDAGLSTYLQPKVLALTHTHSDHAFALPMIATGQNEKFCCLAPQESVPCLRHFLEAKRHLTSCSSEFDLKLSEKEEQESVVLIGVQMEILSRFRMDTLSS